MDLSYQASVLTILHNRTVEQTISSSSQVLLQFQQYLYTVHINLALERKTSVMAHSISFPILSSSTSTPPSSPHLPQGAITDIPRLSLMAAAMC